MRPTVLLTGVTGYIGRRLEKALRGRKDITLRLLVRDARKLADDTRQGAEICQGDAMHLPVLQQALAGVETAIYLVRARGTGQDSRRLDQTMATNFLQACLDQGVGNIICIGALDQPDDDARCAAVASSTPCRILSGRPDRIRTLWLRAGTIIGSGSCGFEILRNLVRNAPLVPVPRWGLLPTHPVGIDDVMAYLVAALTHDHPGSTQVDIDTPPLTFMDMLRQTVAIMGRSNVPIPIPFSIPRLSSLGLAAVTPVSRPATEAFIAELQAAIQGQQARASTFFPEISPAPFSHILRQALDETENDLVPSRWCDASDRVLADVGGQIGTAIWRDRRIHALAGARPRQVFASLLVLGGTRGWLTCNLLWQVRGLIDKAIGGPGLNRGRRQASRLRIGDALDFWRVADLVSDRRLLLQAEMKLPGKAWLEFEVRRETLIQTAFFIPHGQLGRLYWYAMLPWHSLIFPRLCRRIVERARVVAPPGQMPGSLPGSSIPGTDDRPA
ncbi:MAG: SDR family oxidoreductase [Desulfobulbus sp.]|uniref:SDR family oxidoreductase n=1 Tax=Desulfobulbus sp. TaxID=895 RepID=UPI00284FBA91|nr:SDR family oxidoreductase [Desulfobulbus sp.]MDR2550117.1 SDR family oxidoreductase [Desulfobulbus sp.]